MIYHIQHNRPTQNAYIERFNRTYRNEVLNHYLFRDLEEVREITSQWLRIYNEQRPMNLYGGQPLVSITNPRWKTLGSNCPLDGEAYNLISGEHYKSMKGLRRFTAEITGKL
ncbi:MAG: transposase [Nitrospirales bacterium]|nr:transposase [Nitrospirales bacterium]